MPRKRRADRDRIDLRIDRELAERALKRAEQLGVNLSSYIRMVISLDLERVAKEQADQRR